MKFRCGSFLANWSISELNPNPIIVDSGFENISVNISSSTLDFFKLTRSSKKAFFAPLIWNRLGAVL
jgi:hypothetical protein